MESKEIDVNETVKSISKKIEESLEQKMSENRKTDKRLKKFLIFIYTISSALLLILFTPYKQFAYVSNNAVFTGHRGFKSLFLFNNLEESFNGRLAIYYIDFQVLFVELITLTIIFIGLYLISKKATKKD